MVGYGSSIHPVSSPRLRRGGEHGGTSGASVATGASALCVHSGAFRGRSRSAASSCVLLTNTMTSASVSDATFLFVVCIASVFCPSAANLRIVQCLATFSNPVRRSPFYNIRGLHYTSTCWVFHMWICVFEHSARTSRKPASAFTRRLKKPRHFHAPQDSTLN